MADLSEMARKNLMSMQGPEFECCPWVEGPPFDMVMKRGDIKLGP